MLNSCQADFLAFWFGVSPVKQESPSPKCCSQAIAVLPAMLGQSG